MFKMNSLFFRTFILISTSMSLLIVVFNIYSINNKNNALLDVINSQTKTIAKSIVLASSDAMVTEDYSFIVEHNKKIIEDNTEITYITVSKENSKINLINSRDKWTTTQELPAEVREVQLETENGKIIKSTISDNAEVYHYTYPIVFSAIHWGWISIGYSLENYNMSKRSNYIDSIYLFFITLFASLLFSFALARWLLEPIILLKDAAKEVSLGNLHTKVPVRTNDELGELADSFNYMIETIKLSDEKLRHSNDELEKRVEQRTQELYELNISLDKRVKEELHKRVSQERILIQQSRFAAMGEMIGNIAHQWRQPLNALGLLLQNIENAYEMNMLDDAYIARIVEKGNRLTASMSQTIDDFRNFFKPNRDATLFSVASTIETTLEMIGASYSNHNIHILKDIDETLCIKGFSSEFSQVLLNILNNAKDALNETNPSEKNIFLRVFGKNDYVYVEIEDNAGGIPPEIKNSIFDPYFTTKEEGKGTGIGLYMSKTIIESNMQGRLHVEDGAQGANFIIQIKQEICNAN